MNNIAAIGIRASLLGLFAVPILAEVASAQIVPEGSLPNNSIVLPDGNTFTLEGGTTAGSNLFHSFSEFSVPTGSAAIFNNAPAIDNILTRVTGSSVSNIDGLLSANGSANLFLLNPNGIVFGPNARLDIGGSFVGTTADAVEFADGTRFGVPVAPSSSLLTVSVPVGLQMGREPGAIVNRSVLGLSVPTQQTLALIGGDVNLSGGNLSAPGGHIELGSVGDSDRVSLTPRTEGFTFGYETASSFGNVRLSDGAQIDVSGSPSGTIDVRAGTFQLLPNSRIVAFNSGGQPGGDINIVAEDSIELVGTGSYTEDLALLVEHRSGNSSFDLPATGIFAFNFGSGDSSDITVETGQFSARDSALVSSIASGAGRSGSLTLNATGAVDLRAAIFATYSASGSPAEVGDINFSAQRLSLAETAFVETTTFGSGRGGDLSLNTRESIEIAGAGFLITQQADGTSSFFSTGLFSTSAGTGNAGDINLSAPRIRAWNGGTISTNASGGGLPGTVAVNAPELLELSGTFPDFKLRSTAIRANAGGFEPVFTERSGTIRIRAGRLVLRDRGALTVDTIFPGAGGTIDIVADSILLDPGFITAETVVGSGGNIRIQTGNLQLRDESEITVTARSDIDPNLATAEQFADFNAVVGTAGDGGNLTIDADTIVALENSDIRADAPAGFGGQVSITSQGIFGTEFRDVRTEESDITAISALGVQFNGTVSLQTPDADTDSGLIELPTEVIEASDRVVTGCGAIDGSAFTVIGRGGVPEAPGDGLRGQTVWHDVRSSLDTGEETAILPEIPPSTPVWVEAQQWTRHENGTVELLARSSPSPFAGAALDCETLSSDRPLGVD